jgi:hypothetical protein
MTGLPQDTKQRPRVESSPCSTNVPAPCSKP